MIVALQIFNQAYNDVLVLGHTRLSIIDLTSAGHQPMKSQSGRFTVTYNGEIYNYKELRLELSKLGCNFVTNSDTEVLINAWETWGESCLNKLDGMMLFQFLIVNQILYFVCEIHLVLNHYFLYKMRMNFTLHQI